MTKLIVNSPRAVILNLADKSDPLNQLITIGYKCSIGGKPHAWKATVSVEESKNWHAALERCIEKLVRRVHEKPLNPAVEGLPPPDPDHYTFEVQECDD